MAALNHAQLFLNQGRPDLAERELRRAITQEPGDAYARTLLALVLSDLNRPGEALREANAALALDPEEPLAFYARALAHLDQDDRVEAEHDAREAIRLDPENPDSYVLLGDILMSRNRREEALAVAEEALALDPEHVGANNLRAIALVRLDRRDEAGQTIQSALYRDPENATTHANRGWALLHDGDHQSAMEAFREALRLEPGHEWARQGIVEAMKARNPVYRWMLRYFLWMERKSERGRWAFIIGALIVAQLIPPLLPIYLLFMVLSWAADPLFNLVLRLDTFGRLVLSEDEIRGANWIGVCLVIAATLLVLSILRPHPALFVGAAASLAMLVPVGATYSRPPQRRRALAAYTLALALLGVGAVVGFAIDPDEGTAVAGLFVLGWIAFTWLGNFLGR